MNNNQQVPEPTLESLRAEYEVCNHIVEASANRCWLAGTLFIGAAMTGLVYVLLEQRSIQWWEMLIISIPVILLLLFLKLFLINEEWRQYVCHVRMRDIERFLGILIFRVIHLQSRRQSRLQRWGHLRFPWSLFPWARVLNPQAVDPDEDARDEDVRGWLEHHRDIVSRVPFGWEFLHGAAWLVILLWIVVACFGWAGWLN